MVGSIREKSNRVLFIVILVIIVSAISLSFFMGRSTDKTSQINPVIHEGYLDLTSWDFEGSDPITLDGDWEFYWGKFIDPKIFEGEYIDELKDDMELMAVPSDWNRGAYSNSSYLRGYGTYHVRIKLSEDKMTYGMKVLSIRSAHEVYINGEYISGSGKTAIDTDEVIMGNVPYAVYFTSDRNYMDLVIHVSEVKNPTGGLVKQIYFGSEKEISSLSLKSIFFDILSAGSLLMTGLIFLGLFLYWKVDRSTLFFALYCLSFAFFILVYDERILLQLLPMSYELAVKYLNLSLFFSFACILLFMNRSSRLFFSDKALKVYLILFLICMMIILITPYEVYTRFDSVYFFLAVSSYLVMVFNLAKALIMKRYGDEDRSGTLLLFLSAIFITVNLISGILHNESKIFEFATSQLTIMLFVGTASLYLAKKHSDAYSRNEALVDQLREVDRFKDEFLIYTAHEFKTPLNGIINIAQGAFDDQVNPLSDEHRINLRYIKAIATRLSGLVNDIMDMQNIKDNKFKLHIGTVDIHSPIQIIMDVLARIYLDKGLTIINEVPADTYYVIGDENRLRQIFNNLIGNAIKYTLQGQVVIRAEAKNDHVLIYIQDTGLGIEKELQKTIFSLHEFSEAIVNSDPSSSGIGLPLSCKLTEQMNGSIELVKSEVGIGSTFSLTLPKSNEIPTQIPGKKQQREVERDISYQNKEVITDQAKSTNTYTILIVDDEATNIEAVKAIMKHMNYEIISAYSGLQSLEILQHRNDIDLVLLDVMMPGLTGFETLVKMREVYTIIDLPVLIMSVMNDTDSIAYGLSIGANDYIGKPFEAAELLARIQNCVDLKDTYKQMLNFELMFLQAQIKPHFIFNALSIIASLSVKDPVKAKGIVLDLADYLRLSFDFENHSGLTTLENELSLVKAYLSIEQARFTNRLNVIYDVDSEIDCTLPMLTIQPLVENAVRHGIMKNMSSGTITLVVKWIADHIIITVSDNGSGIDLSFINKILTSESTKGHVGIRNIHNRLRKLYGQGLIYESSVEKGTSVSFKIPYISKEAIHEHTHS